MLVSHWPAETDETIFNDRSLTRSINYAAERKTGSSDTQQQLVHAESEGGGERCDKVCNCQREQDVFESSFPL